MNTIQAMPKTKMVTKKKKPANETIYFLFPNYVPYAYRGKIVAGRVYKATKPDFFSNTVVLEAAFGKLLFIELTGELKECIMSESDVQHYMDSLKNTSHKEREAAYK